MFKGVQNTNQTLMYLGWFYDVRADHCWIWLPYDGSALSQCFNNSYKKFVIQAKNKCQFAHIPQARIFRPSEIPIPFHGCMPRGHAIFFDAFVVVLSHYLLLGHSFANKTRLAGHPPFL